MHTLNHSAGSLRKFQPTHFFLLQADLHAPLSKGRIRNRQQMHGRESETSAASPGSAKTSDSHPDAPPLSSVLTMTLSDCALATAALRSRVESASVGDKNSIGPTKMTNLRDIVIAGRSTNQSRSENRNQCSIFLQQCAPQCGVC